MTQEQCQNIINAGIKLGLVHPPASSSCQVEQRQSNAERLAKMRVYMQTRRDKFRKQGKTNAGKPRIRPIYLSLAGWTEEQKKARRKEQIRQWNERNPERIAQSRIYMRNKRLRFKAQGLTNDGKPRKQSVL